MLGSYRTLLALMVAAQHLGGATTLGAYAVFAFYIISGYLMTYIMQQNYGYSRPGRIKYAINRFLRIYPIYWISILITLLAIFLVGEEFSSAFKRNLQYPENLTEVLRNIFIVLKTGAGTRLTPPAWALTVELFFYVLIGIGLSRTKQRTIWWLGVSLLYHAIAYFSGMGWSDRYHTIAAASMPFATGATIYHYRETITKIISGFSERLQQHLPTLLLAAILANWLVGYSTHHTQGALFYLNYLVCAIMLAVLQQCKTLPVVSRKVDQAIGDLSYPIYLIHYQVGLMVAYGLSRMGLIHTRPDSMLFLIALPLILFAAWILTAAVERPIETLRTAVKRNPGRDLAT